jgi:hypothetical protein
MMTDQDVSNIVTEQQILDTNNLINRTQKCAELASNTVLLNKLKVCIYDLNNFSLPKSNDRIERERSSHFLSSVYFNEFEVEYLLAFPTKTGQTYEEIMNEFTTRKTSLSDKIICTSHDIAPIMCDVFQIRKGFEKEKSFKKILKAFNK